MQQNEPKYFDFTLLNSPQKLTAFEIQSILLKEFQANDIKLKIIQIHYKLLEKESKELDLLRRQEIYLFEQYWWSQRIISLHKKLYISQELSLDDHQLLLFTHPQLLNERSLTLARYLDYMLLIESLLQNPNASLMSATTTETISSLIHFEPLKQEYAKKSCSMRVFGSSSEFQKLKNLTEEKGRFLVGGNQVGIGAKELQNVHQLPDEMRLKYQIFETNFQTFEVGCFRQINFSTHKVYFTRFWGLQKVLERFQTQTQIGPCKIMIIKEKKAFLVQIYFDIVVDLNRRINFKVEFRVAESKNPAPSQDVPNQCFSDAPISVEKDQKQQQLFFFIRYVGYPKCYFSETTSQHSYKEPLVIEWFRCQNFLLANQSDIYLKQIIGISSCVRLTIKRSQCQSQDFLDFCKSLEQCGLLRQYSPSLSIQIKDICNERMDFNVKNLMQLSKESDISKSLTWLLGGVMFGRNPIVSQVGWSYNIYLELMRNNKNSLSKVIKEVCRTVQKKRKQTQNFQSLSSNDFASQVQQKLQLLDKSYINTDLRRAIMTPSIIGPLLSKSDTNFQLLKAKIFENDEKRKDKERISKKAFKDYLLLLKIEDDDGQQLEFSHAQSVDINNLQNKVIHYAYWRKKLHDGVEILGDRYVFLGFSLSHLKKNQCILVNQHYADQVSVAILQGVLDRKLDLKRIIPLREIMEVMEEVLGEIGDTIKADEIQVINQSLDISIKESKLFFPVSDIKFQSRNYYARRILLQQGPIPKRVIDQIRLIIFKNPEQIDFTSIVFRKDQYLGVLHLSTIDNDIMLDSDMHQKNSPHNHITQPSDKLYISIAQGDDIHILRYGLYKPCVLQLYQLLNIALLGQSNTQELLWQYVSSMLRALLDAYVSKPRQNEEHKPQLNAQQVNRWQYDRLLSEYAKFFADEQVNREIVGGLKIFTSSPPNIKSIQSLRIPVKQGALLMGVYDERLQPHQVFIQYSPDNRFDGAITVEEPFVLVFKRYSLHYDAQQRFETVSDPNLIQEFKENYLNVIVFSRDMQAEYFPIRDGDLKQNFTVIWDPHLIPIHTEQQNYAEIYESLQYNEDKMDPSDQQMIQGAESATVLEITRDGFSEIKWLERCRDILTDAFTMYQGSQNTKELRGIYTQFSLILLEMLIQVNFDKREEYTDNLQSIGAGDVNKVLTSLNIAALKSLWFSSTQGKIHYPCKKDDNKNTEYKYINGLLVKALINTGGNKFSIFIEFLMTYHIFMTQIIFQPTYKLILAKFSCGTINYSKLKFLSQLNSQRIRQSLVKHLFGGFNLKNKDQGLDIQWDDENIESNPLQSIQIISQCPSFNDKYVLEDKIIGQGAHGVVKMGLRRSDKQMVAVKVCRTNDQEIITLFKNTFQNSSLLSHPVIVKTHEVFVDEVTSTLYLVMEYVDFPSLEHIFYDNIIEKNQEPLVRNIIRQLMLAVFYMHEQGISHRDIKPDNLLVHFEQISEVQVKLIDFGVSKRFSGIDREKDNRDMWTCTGNFLYQAPEIIQGGGYNELIDIWAVGIIMYQLLSGKLPFQGNFIDEVCQKILEAEADMSILDISPIGKDFLKRLLQKDPRKRIDAKYCIQHPWLYKEEIKPKNYKGYERSLKTKKVFTCLNNESYQGFLQQASLYSSLKHEMQEFQQEELDILTPQKLMEQFELENSSPLIKLRNISKNIHIKKSMDEQQNFGEFFINNNIIRKIQIIRKSIY